MRPEAIRVDGRKQWIEKEQGNLVIFVDDEVSFGRERTELISRLRAKGYNVQTDGRDDGRINIWRVSASCPAPNGGGTELGHYFSESSAKKAVDYHSATHPSFSNWKVRHSCLTTDQYLVVNNGKFKSRSIA